MKPDFRKNLCIAALHTAKWLPPFALFASAAGILFSHTDLVNHTWIWAAVLQITAAILLLPPQLKCFCWKKRTAFAAGMLTVFLLMMLSVRELTGHPLADGVLPVVQQLLLAPACFVVLYRALSRFCGPVPPERKAGSLLWLKVLLAAEGMCFLFANYPFRPSVDSLNVYNAVINRIFSDWHTIGYQLYVWFCMLFGRVFGWYHPFMACLVQTVFWFVLLFRLGLLLRRLYGQRAEKAWYVLNAVMYIPLLYLGVMYKDVVFSMSVLGLCGELLYLLSAGEHRKSDTVFLLLCSTGAAVFRHGMVIITVISLVTALICVRRRRKKEKTAGSLLRPLRTALAFSLGCFILLQAGGNYVLHMRKNPSYMKFTVPLYVCGNIASTHPELLDREDVELLEYLMPLETWQRAYHSNTYWGDTVSRDWGYAGSDIGLVDNAYGMKIVGLNAKIFFKNPGAFLDAATRVTSIVWQVARPQDGYEWSSAGYYWLRDDPDADPALCSADTGLKEVLEKLETDMQQIPVVSSLYYRGGIWSFLLLLIWAVLILKRKARLLPAFLPPLLFFAGLMLFCPAQDPRFILPLMETGMLGLVAARYVPAGETPEIDTAQAEKV